MSDQLLAALAAGEKQINDYLVDILPSVKGLEKRLLEAMHYAAMAGGKRLRPFLVLNSANLFGVEEAAALRVAAAIELLHTYSLVHDDLPCMDDDDLRRGRPTTHVQYDDATAVLVGDALLTYAFEIISHPATHQDPQVRCELVAALARAAGPNGMVGGQMIDMRSEMGEIERDKDTITRFQRLKTGELFAFSCEAGAILGKAEQGRRQALNQYAHDFGLAFQIKDDILDVEGDPDVIGKSANKDAEAGKITFVTLLGLENAKEQAQMLADQAVKHLDMFDERADMLRQVAGYAVSRNK